MAKLASFFKDGVGITEVSADPSSPREGQLQVSDGTHRTEGLWVYKGATWLKVNTGAGAQNLTTKTAAYTATTSDDIILVDATSAAFTLTLPAAASNSGKLYRVVKIDNSENVVTIDGNASETINGSTDIELSGKNSSLVLVCDGTEWFTAGGEEIIACTYRDDSGASVAGLGTIKYTDKDHDTHGMYNISTGVGTFPADGIYCITAYFRDSTAANRSIVIDINGGSRFYEINSQDTGNSDPVLVSATVQVSKGDTWEILNGLATSLNLNPSLQRNCMSVFKIG